MTPWSGPSALASWSAIGPGSTWSLERRGPSFGTASGQSLSGPPGSTSLLILGADAVEVADKGGIEALRNGRRVPGERVGGRAQLVAFSYGKGRVVVGGEAAMFTAQRVRLPGGQVEETGLPVDDDKQLTLNILHWLSRLIG